MIYKDLREWIEALDKEGDLLRLKDELPLEPNAGAAARASCNLQGPGILFEKPAGYHRKMAISLHGAFRRTAMAMGLPSSATNRQQMEHWIKSYENYPVKSRFVKYAPCKENVLTGDSINLFDFPFCRTNSQDASFYITKTCVVTKDPESDWINVGTYRMMILDRDRTGILFEPSQHIGIHFHKYLKMGKTMPAAVTMGVEPTLPLITGSKAPAGWNEYDLVGAVRGEPEELVMAETVKLPVPATAEIVLEGEVVPEKVFEGPYGEFPGSYSAHYLTPLFKIKTITHRNDPILDTVYTGRPNSENQYLSLVSKLASVWKDLKQTNPSITDMAYLGPYVHNLVIQGKWRHSAEPRQAMLSYFGGSWGFYSKMVICVDDDVDPWNAYDVLWAIATRTQADQDLIILPNCKGYTDPGYTPEGLTCKFGIDATKSRPPHIRHKPVTYITPPPGTEGWEAKIKEFQGERSA